MFTLFRGVSLIGKPNPAKPNDTVNPDRSRVWKDYYNRPKLAKLLCVRRLSKTCSNGPKGALIEPFQTDGITIRAVHSSRHRRHGLQGPATALRAWEANRTAEKVPPLGRAPSRRIWPPEIRERTPSWIPAQPAPPHPQVKIKCSPSEEPTGSGRTLDPCAPITSISNQFRCARQKVRPDPAFGSANEKVKENRPERLSKFRIRKLVDCLFKS